MDRCFRQGKAVKGRIRGGNNISLRIFSFLFSSFRFVTSLLKKYLKKKLPTAFDGSSPHQVATVSFVCMYICSRAREGNG